MEYACLATVAMTWQMEPVFSRRQTMLVLLMSAALSGTGASMHVQSAQRIGFSTQIKYAFPLMINASLQMQMENALHAIKDMT